LRSNDIIYGDVNGAKDPSPSTEITIRLDSHQGNNKTLYKVREKPEARLFNTTIFDNSPCGKHYINMSNEGEQSKNLEFDEGKQTTEKIYNVDIFMNNLDAKVGDWKLAWDDKDSVAILTSTSWDSKMYRTSVRQDGTMFVSWETNLGFYSKFKLDSNKRIARYNFRQARRVN